MLIKADLNELVFRARNKEYGAYQLRKMYQRSTLLGVFIAMAVLTLATLSPKIYEALKSKEEEVNAPKRKIAYADLAEPPPINEDQPPPPPPTQALPPPPQRAAIRFVPPDVVKDEDVKEEIEFVNQDTLQKTNIQIGKETVEGDPFANSDGLDDGEGVVEVQPELREPEPQEPDIDAFVAVEKEPAPVNMDALKKSMGYPPIAREANIQGSVVVRVLVDKFGNYSKHKVLRSPHQSLTKVVEDNIKMLKFTPGIQAGKPIPCWVTVPVRFSLNN